MNELNAKLCYIWRVMCVYKHGIILVSIKPKLSIKRNSQYSYWIIHERFVLGVSSWDTEIVPYCLTQLAINRAEMTTISWWECTHTVGSALSGRVSIKIIINKRQQDSAFSRAQGARTLEARVCHSKKFSLRVGINALEMATKLIINNSLGRWINQGWSPSWATTICLYACVVT